MSVTSYNLKGSVYEFLNGATVVERFYLPDSYVAAPSIGDTLGIRISEDGGSRSLLLSAADLVAIGLATPTIFTTQFNTDKGQVGITNGNEGNVGSLNTRTFYVTQDTLGASTTAEITIAVPDGAIILGVSLNNDLAVTTSAGDDTYDAAFSGGDTTAIDTGILGALDTKTDGLFVPILTTGVTEITVTAGNSENFATGTISALVYYQVLTSMDDA